MTTASTNTVIAHTSDATYRVWVAEIITQLLAVGLTQTADTGQVNVATVTRPAINTLNAYAIFRFNDTLHGTNPIFIRIDFGTGTVATTPQMRVSVAQSTDGAGTLTGLATTRVGCNAQASAPISTILPYSSRFCYNATQGFLGMVWKQQAHDVDCAYGGFFIFRSVDAAGAPTADATHVLAQAASDTGGVTANVGTMQVISTVTSSVYNTAPFPSVAWANGPPLALANTLVGANAQVFPVWQYTPRLGITNQLAVAVLSEIAVNSTVAITVLGALSVTYLSVGGMTGCGSTFGSSYASNAYSVLMLWQ